MRGLTILLKSQFFLIVVMPLTPSQASTLELAIQSALSRIPMVNDEWHQRKFIKEYEINDPDDFIYGYAIGFIANAFHNLVFISQGRSPTEDEKREAQRIVLHRAQEIRNAISLRRYQR
jgi:hypothetical protein